ncbi:hypothetical protein Zmor_012930 [Zophobas morio]|uniref:Uncharacterized protein n=1 Tax=Zophobas morio TaxID=2755281 RepID=A0AA38MET0_9CUCU|nr:hypothetical protein Zmor_012930 [Zophobas morio]
MTLSGGGFRVYHPLRPQPAPQAPPQAPGATPTTAGPAAMATPGAATRLASAAAIITTMRRSKNFIILIGVVGWSVDNAVSIAADYGAFIGGFRGKLW